MIWATTFFLITFVFMLWVLWKKRKENIPTELIPENPMSKNPIYDLKFVVIPQAEVIEHHCSMLKDVTPTHTILKVYPSDERDIYVLGSEEGVAALLIESHSLSIYFQLLLEDVPQEDTIETLNVLGELTLSVTKEGYEHPQELTFKSVGSLSTDLVAIFQPNAKYHYTVYRNEEDPTLYAVIIIDTKLNKLYTYVGMQTSMIEYI